MNSNDKNDKNKIIVLEDEKKLLLDHDYDGIQELNHPLPKWWNFIFYTSCLFGLGYWAYYSFLGGPTQRDDLKQEMVGITAKQDEYKKLNSQYNEAKFAEFDKPENLLKGKEVFANNCVQCHEDGGYGNIGPNLTDDYWLVSKGNPETNYNIVYSGSEANGMPAWGEVLSSDDIYLALVYVKSLKNTFHPKGKEAQGEKVVEQQEQQQQ
ncbi:MAG: cbb3-type cytochrome c oxidase N-terminal domain-containing protein [Bacteriovoracaceae bacterium]|nr:cbb3-type cytochrome c oxidase N-terminal domain-containing protein [Bacteriovoracaceae bacterium]